MNVNKELLIFTILGGKKMAGNYFDSMESYRIIDHMYDQRKDFIILGLCGRVGSGVSTVSSILEKTFDNLQLPRPGFDNPNRFNAHEYRILYTYAKQNWKPFYKIRTSALISRYILDYPTDSFAKFLYFLQFENEGTETEWSQYITIARNYFDQSMECDVIEFCEALHVKEINNTTSPWKLFERDNDINELVRLADQSPEDGGTGDRHVEIKIRDDTIVFDYNNEKNVCVFKNSEMSKLLKIYANLRREKSGFQNPFWYLALKQYLYDFLPNITKKLWDEVRKKSTSLPTQALQCMGNNLRLTKTPYFSTSNKVVDDGYVCIAEDINLAVKVLRAFQLKLQESAFDNNDNYTNNSDAKIKEIRTIIVIDSIKNPYESLYLKARYSNYYLIGVYTEDSERRKRLREREHLIDDDIKAIDIIEQNTEFKKEIKAYHKYVENNKEGECKTPKIIRTMYNQFCAHDLMRNLPYISPFVLQNVSSCLDSADILINNITDNFSYTYLKRILLRYVCLIMNPGIVLPTEVERCMQIANTAKLNSGCISRQVGAVLTDSDYHLLSIGWNQQPEGQIPCSYRDLCELYHHWDTEVYSDYENNDNDVFQIQIKEQVEDFFDTDQSPLIYKGKLPHYCFKDYQNSIDDERNQVHTRALHAEETAFLNLGPNKERVRNGTLFTTSSPCELCSKKAMQLGISTIYYVEAYTGVSQKHVLNIGNPQIRPNLVLFTGAIGTAYTKLFTPLLLQKDETEMWLGAKMDVKLMKTIQDLKEESFKKNEVENGE